MIININNRNKRIIGDDSIYENTGVYIVCYIDMLGVTNKLKTQGESVYGDLWLINHNLKKQAYKHKDIVVRTFSDNYFIALPIKDNLNEQLSKITQIVGYTYASCLCSANIPLRGYITTGKMHIDDDTVIGPALIEAHKFESKSANYPRICIDYDLVKTSEKDRNNYQDTIFLDNDLIPCLNVLKHINQDYLKAIKNSIRISLIEDIRDLSSDALPKRLWLINYVNEYYLQNFNEHIFNIDNLSILSK